MSLNLNYKADVVVETENLNREDWLNYRRQGIGGSDAAAIMGVSPFCSKRDLYQDKCGIVPAMDEEESMVTLYKLLDMGYPVPVSKI